MGFALAKCVHLQKGRCTLVQPCAMTVISVPINLPVHFSHKNERQAWAETAGNLWSFTQIYNILLSILIVYFISQINLKKEEMCKETKEREISVV